MVVSCSHFLCAMSLGAPQDGQCVGSGRGTDRCPPTDDKEGPTPCLRSHSHVKGGVCEGPRGCDKSRLWLKQHVLIL